MKPITMAIARTLIGATAMGYAHGASMDTVDMTAVCRNLGVEYPLPNMTVTLPDNHDWLCWDHGDGRGISYYAHMRDIRALRHWETSSADDDGVEVNDSER